MKPKDRVRLPTGRLGTITRVLKSGALAILLDDGEQVNLFPSLATVVEQPALPEGRAELAQERANLARELYDARVKIQEAKTLLATLLTERKGLWERYLACNRRDRQVRHSDVLAVERRRRLREQYEQGQGGVRQVSRET
jgi:hypothetical protein